MRPSVDAAVVAPGEPVEAPDRAALMTFLTAGHPSRFVVLGAARDVPSACTIREPGQPP